MPPGLTFDPATRRLRGTPTGPQAATTYTYTVTDADGRTVTLTFTITITAPGDGGPGDGPGPTFGSQTITDKGYFQGAQIDTLTLPAPTGGRPPFTYALTPALPPGLTFDPATRRLRGTPTGPQAATTYTYTVTDADGRAVTLTFTLAVQSADRQPEFGRATIAHQRYEQNKPVREVLPAATNGNAPLTYTLTPALPAGLAFDAGTRELRGTPTAAQATRTYTYTVTDQDGDTATLTFRLTITAPEASGAHQVVAPEALRALVGHTTSAIRRRVNQSTGRGQPSGPATLGGQSTLAGILTTHGRALAEGTLAVDRLLANSEFAFGLGPEDGDPTSFLSTLGVWGRGDYRNLSDTIQAVQMNGEALNVHLGADARLHRDLLVGVAGSWGRGQATYQANGRGKQQLALTSVHPYLAYQMPWLSLWGTGGYGWGDFETTDAAGTRSRDVTMRTVGGGFSGQVFGTGANALRVKTEAMQAQMTVQGQAGEVDFITDVYRLRVSVEGTRTWLLESGARVQPRLEVGYRRDGGDGSPGHGAVVLGGLALETPGGLRMESNANVLLGRQHRSEWGVSGGLLWGDQAAPGLSLQVTPGYGNTAPGTAEMVWTPQWSATQGLGPQPPGGQVDAAVGYGFRVTAGGLLTPYGQTTLGATAHSHRLGLRFLQAAAYELKLEGSRITRTGPAGPDEHIIMLSGSLLLD